VNIGIFSTQIGTRGTGPEVIDRNIIATLGQMDRRNEYTVYCLSEQGARSLRLTGPNFRVRVLKPASKWAAVTFGMSWELMRQPIDLLHATFVAPLYSPCPYVFTLTCWSPFDRPDFYPPGVRWRTSYLFNRSVMESSGILCISNFIRERLLERFPQYEHKVFVTYPGVAAEFRPIPDKEAVRARLQPYGVDSPFILFASSLTRRKNPEGLLRAFGLLVAQQKIDHKLVLIGDRTWLGEEVDPLIDRLQLRSRVIFAPCPHEDVPWFYNGADALIFPSLYEGFGMPPIECMACGTPVVASNLTAIPEVVGDAALLVDPCRVDDLAGGIYRVLTDDSMRADLIRKGFERARKFTWDSAAASTLDAYTKSCPNGNGRKR